jgi:hypothetical protein
MYLTSVVPKCMTLISCNSIYTLQNLLRHNHDWKSTLELANHKLNLNLTKKIVQHADTFTILIWVYTKLKSSCAVLFDTG